MLPALRISTTKRSTTSRGSYAAQGGGGQGGGSGAAPTVSSITPLAGAPAGGTAVTLAGTGFVTGATVAIGGSTATSVVVVSGLSITCVTPSGTAGPKNVVVTNPDAQTGTLTNGYAYITLASVSPTTGVVGTTITFTGTGFAAGQAVLIGGVAADNIVYTSSTSIDANVPTGVSGLVSVSVAGVTLADAVTVYLVPDLVNNASFETGWDGFTNWSGGTPSQSNISRATDYAYAGSYSVRETWVPNPSGDGGAQLANILWPSGYNRLWVRFYVRFSETITTVWKFSRWYNTGFTNNLGGLYYGASSYILNSGFGWGGMNENGGVLDQIGITPAMVVDGAWHSVEYDYWRVGDPSGYASAAFWFDGTQVSMPDGTGSIRYYGETNQSYWLSGRLYSGRAAGSGQIDTVEWIGTLNAGNTTTGQVNLDRIAISSLGRIGP